MASERDIIDYKTRAWADPRMVDWYAKRVSENIGVNRLINRVETGLIAANVLGRDVLDVGIGSGRASLPLLDRGITVTGIDSSQAMLDECRRRAGGRPIRLEPGDVTAIPFATEAFDSVVSLNVLTHFPNWREVLPEWLRVLRPGGRLVFDVYSLDHAEAVAASQEVDVETLLAGHLGEDPARYNLRLKVAELAEFATARGVSLIGIHPYSGTVGGDQNFWLARGWANGRVWERMKSWIAEDDRLFEFLAFLEEALFTRLNSRASGRFMVVLEKSPDTGSTAQVLARQQAVALAAAAGRLADLEPFLGMPAAQWRARLDAHLDHPPNRLVLFQLLTAALAAGQAVDLADSCAPRHAEVLDRWMLAFDLDRQIYDLASGWHRNPALAEVMTWKGVPLGPGLEYDTVQALMRAALSVGEGNGHA
jgi:SAM-dependent methyltransferase